MSSSPYQSLLKPELVLRLALYPDVNPEHLPSVQLGLGKLIVRLILGRRDEQLGAYKGTAGDVSRGQEYLPNNLALGGDPYHSATAVDGAPDASVRVDGKAIRFLGFAELKVHPLVADGAGAGIEVERVDSSSWRVSYIHGVILVVPANAIGDSQLLQHTVKL